MFLYELFGWIDVALAICGLGICIRYARLSDRMPWLVLAFGVSACTGAGNRLTFLAIKGGLFPSDIATVIYTLSGLGSIVASALLVFGLLGVLKDVRERFHFMREAYEDREGRPSPSSPSKPASIFEPTDPTP